MCRAEGDWWGGGQEMETTVLEKQLKKKKRMSVKLTENYSPKQLRFVSNPIFYTLLSK